MAATRVVNLRHEAYDVYCGRPGRDESGPFGNPFQIGRDGDRAEVIAKHDRWINGDAELARQVGPPPSEAAIMSLEGKRLGCFCYPLPCHCDNYVRFIRQHGGQ